MPVALERLTSYIHLAINDELVRASEKGGTLDPAPCQRIIQTYDPEIISDVRFDGASIETIRAAFRSLVDQREEDENWTDEEARISMCIMIDEESLTSVLDGGEPASPTDTAQVKVIDSYYDPVVGPQSSGARGREDTTFPRSPYEGWVKVPCKYLWSLYGRMPGDGGLEMQILIKDEAVEFWP